MEAEKMIDTQTEPVTGIVSALQRSLSKELRKLLERKAISQSQLAAQIGISGGSLSQILSDDRAFSDGFLSKIRRYVGDHQIAQGKLFTNIRQYQQIMHIANWTRKNGIFTLLTGHTGVGKTTAVRQINASVAHTYYIKVEDDLTWRELLRKIAVSLGVHPVPYRTDDIRSSILSRIEATSDKHPLLIIDEAEELSDAVARKLKRLHTLTEGLLGVLIVAHTHLRTRLARGSSSTHRRHASAWQRRDTVRYALS